MSWSTLGRSLGGNAHIGQRHIIPRYIADHKAVNLRVERLADHLTRVLLEDVCLLPLYTGTGRLARCARDRAEVRASVERRNALCRTSPPSRGKGGRAADLQVDLA